MIKSVGHVMGHRIGKIKICFVIHSLHTGGMERVMSELAKQFSMKENIELHLVLYGRSRTIFYDIPKNVTLHKPGWSFRDDMRLIFTLRTLIWLRRTVSSIKPDTILSLGEYWNSFVLLALKGKDVPIYVSDRCRPDLDLGQPHEWLRKWLYPNASGIISQTQKAKDIYTKKFNHPNIRVIPNPIHEVKQIEKSVKKEDIILSVGRLIETKHHDRLIRIFDRVKKDNWKLVIVGGDAIQQNCMKQLKELIYERDLKDRVELTGNVSDVEKYYLKSKIFAFTSSSEGYPNVIGEAMSAGLPVIAYDCVAGPSEMVEDTITGYLVDTFDDQRFTDRLSELMESEILRNKMGEKAKTKIQKLSENQIADQFFSFILP